MSEVFEGYERQYCELSANLSKKCTAATALNGGKLELAMKRLIPNYKLVMSNLLGNAWI